MLKHFQRCHSTAIVTINVLVLSEALGELPEFAGVVCARHGFGSSRWHSKERLFGDLLGYLYPCRRVCVQLCSIFRYGDLTHRVAWVVVNQRNLLKRGLGWNLLMV
jgi:hypothetical protein